MEDLTEYNYTYTFKFSEELQRTFNITISKKDMLLQLPERENYPDWCNLDKFKCPNCPLDSSKIAYCPMAVSIIDVIEAFKDIYSYEEVEVTVESDQRNYFKKGAIQDALSSLMGLYMATSGCPNLVKLKPMAATHLPFSSLEETRYRVLTMHALAQLFKDRENQAYASDFVELKELYKSISIVNTQFCKRLRYLEQKDANVNAVVILNNFAEFLPLSINEDMIDEIQSLFKDYL